MRHPPLPESPEALYTVGLIYLLPQWTGAGVSLISFQFVMTAGKRVGLDEQTVVFRRNRSAEIILIAGKADIPFLTIAGGFDGLHRNF